MHKYTRPRGIERQHMIEELHQRYALASHGRQHFIYLRKKYAWLLVVETSKFLKRLIDIVVSLFGLLILSPLLGLIAILIKLTDSGPVLYVSKRVGKWGKEFTFPKFRTMNVGADKLKQLLENENVHKNLKTFKMHWDPRLTPLGKMLRRTSLDELPQLWSVLKGDMSLVGPRPPLPEEVALYTLEERRRLDVVPGITCIWQVSGRSDIPFNKQVSLDLEYIESQSLWLDMKLLLKTIPAVLLGRGAY